jgi:hypothetical protein
MDRVFFPIFSTNYMESITLTREELYNLVWTESMLSLSKKYDISDVGLRKMCKRNDIPIPNAGHWMKVKFGKKSPRLKLPATTTSKEKIRLEIRTEKTEAEKAANQIEDDPTLHIKIPDQLIKPDKLIIEVRDELSSKDRYDRYDSFRTSGGDTLDIRATDNFIPRCLRFMDTVIKTLKLRGHEIRIENSSYKPGTYVYFGEEKVQIYLRERMKRVTTNDGHYNRYDMVPSGMLFFRVDGENAQEFRDGTRTLEEQFPDIILKIELEGRKLIAKKIELKKYWAIQEAKRKKEEELGERRQKEVKDLIKLLVKFNRWQQTQQLREYLDELEKKTILDNKHTEDFRSWIKRAREKADWLDPMIEHKDEWLDEFDREKVIARANQTD